MEILLTVIRLFGLVYTVCAYKLKCPEALEWSFRARGLCPDPSKYYCLWDGNSKVFTEGCDKLDLTRKGERIVIKGNFDSKSCPKDVYQPYIHFTNESSGCIHKKSFCNEEGQVVYNNTDTKRDIKCTCDYTKGYEFITKPNNPCYCIPTEEDCSCYLNHCLKKELMSEPRCTNRTHITFPSNCLSVRHTSAKDKPFSKPVDIHKEETSDTVTKPEHSNIVAFIFVCAMIGCVICIIMGLIVCLHTSKGYKLAFDMLKKNTKAFLITHPLDMVECSRGKELRLTCETSKKKCEVYWTHGDTEYIGETNDGLVYTLYIEHMSESHVGEYVLYLNEKPVALTFVMLEDVFVSDIETQTCVEGDASEFSVKLCDEKVTAEWYKDDQKLVDTDNIVSVVEGATHRLRIHKCFLSDSGLYTIKVENARRNAELTVTAVFVSDMETQTCVEGDATEFSIKLCDENMTAEWYRDDQKLVDTDNIMVVFEGINRRLCIQKCSLSDSGLYTIKVGNATRNAELTVTEFITSPITDTVTLKGLNVSMVCKAAKCGLKPKWYKDTEEVKQSDDVTINESEGVYTLTFLKVNHSKEGKYRIELDGHISEANLYVKDIPQIILDQIMEHERLNFIERVNSGCSRRDFIRIVILGEKSDWKTNLQRCLLDHDVGSMTSTDDKSRKILHHGDCTIPGEDIIIERRKYEIDMISKQWTFAADNDLFPYTDEKNKSYFDCACWNFVGEREYYATHHVFLTSNTICILAVDLSKEWKTNKSVENCAFEDIGGNIEFWIDSIRCYVNHDKPTQRDNHILPVLLIRNKTDQDEFENYLDGLSDVKREYLANRFYVSLEDENFAFIRQRIFELAEKLPKWGEGIHWTWVLLERQLLSLKEQIITYANVKDLADMCCFPTQDIESTLNSFLEYEHEIGNILFFDCTCAKDYIVLDPRWLVNIFKCILVPNPEQRKDINVTELKKSGSVKVRSVSKLFEKRFSNTKYVRYAKAVMECFNILIPYNREEHSLRLEKYYIPSMIEATTIDSVKDRLNVQNCKITSWLCLEFDFLPPGFFSLVLANCATKYDRVKVPELGLILSRCFGVFNCDENGCKKLVFCVSSNTIAMQVWLWVPTDEECHSKLRVEILEMIKSLEEKYAFPIKYFEQLKCSHGNFNRNPGKIRTSKVNNDEHSFYCEEHSTEHQYKELYRHWFEKPSKNKHERFENSCSKCKRKDTSYYCIECNASFCESCFNSHQKQESAQSHNMVYKEDEYELEPHDSQVHENVEISDLKKVGNDMLCIADSKGGWLIVIGKQEKKTTLKLPDKPRSMAVIDNTKLAVTLPESGMVVIVEIKHGVVKILENIRAGEERCYGIAFSTTCKCLFVGCFDRQNRYLKMYSTSDELLHVSDKRLPFDPKNICAIESRIYCIDGLKLWCIEAQDNFKQLFTFGHMEMVGPCSLTNNDIGNVLVLCQHSNNIYRVWSDNHEHDDKGKIDVKHKIVVKQLQQSIGVSCNELATQSIKIPCICYDSLSNSIFIGIGNTIHKYKQIAMQDH